MSTTRQLVCLEIAGRTLAVWSDDVIEVLRMVALQPLGELNPFLMGALNRRGAVVTVYDLRKALNLPTAPPQVTDLLVILQTRQGHCAICVDAVSDIIAVEAGRTAERLPGLGRHVAEVANLSDRIVPVLDLDWLLAQGDDRAVTV